jgi:hypothetical protein
MGAYLTALAPTLLQLGLLAALYALLRRLHHALARLPEKSHREPILVLELLRRPTGALLFAGTLLPLAAFSGDLSWQRVDPAGWARPFVAFVVAGGCVFGATYAFNWYFDRAHLFDRALLVALGAAGVLGHPLFLAPFVVLFVTVMHQFVHPVHPADTDDLNLYCHKIVFSHQILAFLAFLDLSLLWRGLPEIRLAQLLVLVQGANYGASAIGKARLGWTSRNELVGLVAAAVAHGWLPADSPATSRVIRFVRATNRVLLVSCLTLEGGAALMLVARPLGAAVLVGLAGFHLAVLALSGINFLPWCALDLALAVVVWVQPDAAFGLSASLAAWGATAACMQWMRPYCLAWLDAPLCTAFRFEALGLDGKMHALPPDVFAPYDITVTNGKFRAMVDEKIAVDAWAECYDADEYEELKKLRSWEDVRAVEERIGRSYYHPVFEDRIRRFVTAYAAAHDAKKLGRGRGLLARDWLGPNRAWGVLLAAPLATIRVRVVRVLQVGDRCHEREGNVSCEVPVLRTADPVPLARDQGAIVLSRSVGAG